MEFLTSGQRATAVLYFCGERFFLGTVGPTWKRGSRSVSQPFQNNPDLGGSRKIRPSQYRLGPCHFGLHFKIQRVLDHEAEEVFDVAFDIDAVRQALPNCQFYQVASLVFIRE